MPVLVGRGALTAAATLALVGGGASVAFAGEAPADTGSDHGTSQDSGKHGGHGDKHGDNKHNTKHDKCEIDLVDPTAHQIDDALGGAAGPVYNPVHEVVCPPVAPIVNPILPGGDDDATNSNPAGDVTNENPTEGLGL